MIDLTIHNTHQHQHFQLTGLSTIHCDELGTWRLVDPSRPTNANTISIVPDGHSTQIAIECDGVQCLECATRVARGSRLSLGDHLHLVVGNSHIEISATSEVCQSRPLEPLAAEQFDELRSKQDGGPAPATLGRWFAALSQLHRWSANREEFYQQAAQFLVEPVGLDGGMVLRKQDDAWEIAASHLPNPEFGVAFDRIAVEQVCKQKRTMFHASKEAGTSLVLSPVANNEGEVVAMLYGYRSTHGNNGRRAVRYLEAQLVELLADSVRYSLQRLCMEAEAARNRVRYEHAFSPRIAQQVELDTAALTGREQEVTVLFADLRGFAKLCQQLSTPDTYVLLNEVMDVLTTAVMQHGGTLIDYYGDGLAAMWNAPLEQSHHALRACRAALTMQQAVPTVSDHWQHLLDGPLQLGIGIHTGTAQVGNIGSSMRLKYGPRGATVNLASRLEQATKLLECPVVATREVVQQLEGELLDYRLCQAELPGIEQPLDIFAIYPATSDQSLLEAISLYEDALTQFEAGDLDAARDLLDDISQATNLPTKFLIDQVDQEHHRRLGRRAGDQPELKQRAAVQLRTK